MEDNRGGKLKTKSEELIVKEQGQGKGNKDYWELLQKKADDLYSGLNVEVDLLTGLYEDNEYKGEIKLSIPIYSKEEEKKKKKEKMEFLDKGAELIKELDLNRSRIKIYKEKAKYMKAMLLEDGRSSINDYYEVLEDIKTAEAEVDEVTRKLETMIGNN
ncbi:hypothetical protein [Orenia marismortui]|uniref:hypothetical protein n=1 Tax=Orenia marismortui TaxID=46469 RepID=UPI0012F94890|nr:hypothetical protein [Orenia marismortui]